MAAAEFDQKAIEEKWQQFWDESKLYHFDPQSDKPPYTIDNPPRYASGPLHAGHAVHYTHIDFIARYKRMRGYNVMFPLCFDVNGMPIEVNVEKKYGIQMGKTDRHEFIKLCEKFAEGNIGEMTRQFRILGESMDPSVYYQTDAHYYRRLTQVSFIRLFHRDLVYKGERPVNWCPRCTTALADAEIEYSTRQSKLNYIVFTNTETGEPLEIATTRPELICTCQVVAVNPDDPRADALVHTELQTPIFNRRVKIITDDNVDPSFGTGVVMICTIGDRDDLEWVYRYDLPLEMGIDTEGKMTEQAEAYEGLDLNEARKKIIEDMKAQGLLIKQEDLEQNVGCCWRCHTPIEFLVKPQWFLKILPFKSDVLAAADQMTWYPEFMKVRLEDWVDSLSWDWVISRQRYFATPIPVWECEHCAEVVVAEEDQCYADPTIDNPPVEKCPKCGGKLIGCEDVFDTWMDSSISPLYCSFWERDEALFQRLYPTSLRPQAHDIIRTWAFYTILRGLLLTNQKPFKEMMVDGFILAEDGTPMHASKGNIIDPLEVLEKYGADAYRYYAGNCAIGEDNAFRYKDIKRGIKFTRKLWNIGQFLKYGREKQRPLDTLDYSTLEDIDTWIVSKYSRLVESCTEEFDHFRFDRVLRLVEYFIWHELADHYIELTKHRIYRDSDPTVITLLSELTHGLLKLIAPILPHVTEEIYHEVLKNDSMPKSLHISQWPEPLMIDAAAEKRGELVKSIVSEIRRYKSENGIALNAPLKKVSIITYAPEQIQPSQHHITETVHAESLEFRSAEELSEVVTSVDPVFAKLGPIFKQDTKVIIAKLKAAEPPVVAEGLKTGGYAISLDDGETVVLTDEFVTLNKSLKLAGETVDTLHVEDVIVAVTRE